MYDLRMIPGTKDLTMYKTEKTKTLSSENLCQEVPKITHYWANEKKSIKKKL